MDGSLKYYRFEALLLQQGWIRPCYVGVDNSGTIKYLSEQAGPDSAVEFVNGIAMPGFPNGHSHAFQFAMAGMAEKHQPGSTDDFWTWREAMYECALTLGPEHIEAVAAMLYAQMLRNGITQVTEFHYLHHDLNGKCYGNLAETGERHLAAARMAGIKITLVPVFYQKGGFGKPPHNRQCRFISADTDSYLRLLEATQIAARNYPEARLGFGVHSLRAVNARDIFKTVESGPKELPFHIHAAEQLLEVDECKEFLGQRPVEWLLNNLPLKERFNLVHCTHLNDEEVIRLAKSRANVVLCPSTEGNLGDGIFRLREFASHYGNWCIGTDSQIRLSPLEDLRWLDYSQRVHSHRRNTFDDGATELVNKAITCGRRAAGEQPRNYFEVDAAFDAVVFNAASPLLKHSLREHLLQTLVYTSGTSDIIGTIVNGRWVVRNDRLENEDLIESRFHDAVKELAL